MTKEHTGFLSGIIALVTLANVNLLIGCCTGVLMGICLLPVAVKRWRALLEDYKAAAVRVSRPRNIATFTRYCLGEFD